MKNKKGQLLLGTTAYIIITILLVIAILAFFLFPSVKYTFVGIALIIASFYSLKVIKNNKSKLFIFFILLFLGLLCLFLFSNISQNALDIGTYIQAPTFYYYECAPASGKVESIKTNLTTGSSGWMIIPSNTDTADLYIRQIEKTAWFATDRRIIYQICHKDGSCDPQVSTPSNKFLSKNGVPTVTINLLSTDKIWINYQYQNLLFQWKDYPNGAEYYFTYTPFILWKVDMFGGGKIRNITTQTQGCNFPSGTTNNLLNNVINSKKQINIQTSNSNSHLNFYETRNFIGTYIPISTANVNFVTYNGKNGYCLNRQIFAITTAETNDEIYQIVDNNFNTLIANSVTCCPGETQSNKKCGSDFKWHTIEEAQCSAFNACAGADWSPNTEIQLIRYNCIDNKCVPETKSVQCTTSSVCQSGYNCDMNTYTCIKVDTGNCTNGYIFLNGVCVKNECPIGQHFNNNNICVNDGVCNWYETPVIAQTKDYGFLYWRALLNVPIVSSTTECKISNWVYLLAITLSGTIIGITYIIVNKKPKHKKRK